MLVKRELWRWREKGKEMRGGITRYADQVVGAVWRYPLGSPALDSCSLGKAMQHTRPVAQTIPHSPNLLCYHEEQREAADFSD